MADDDLSRGLEEIRARNEERIAFYRYTEYTVEHDVAEGDVRRLLAALDAVLVVARTLEPSAADLESPDNARWLVASTSQHAAREIREAIAGKLTGGGE